jgi:hypothetical protein
LDLFFSFFFFFFEKLDLPFKMLAFYRHPRNLAQSLMRLVGSSFLLLGFGIFGDTVSFAPVASALAFTTHPYPACLSKLL